MRALMPVSDDQSRYKTVLNPYGQNVMIKHGIQMTPEHYLLYDVSAVRSLSDLCRFVKYQCYQRGFAVCKQETLSGGEVIFKCVGSPVQEHNNQCPFRLSYKGFAFTRSENDGKKEYEVRFKALET